MADEGDNGRMLPQSDLDFTLMTTDAVWGTNYINPEFKQILKKQYPDKVNPETGEVALDETSLWGLFSFYTRDLRLANLSPWNGEMTYCQYWLDYARDCLMANYTEPFMISLGQVATVLELSQSKGGFLRKISKTWIGENRTFNDEPAMKGLFGQKKNEY